MDRMSVVRDDLWYIAQRTLPLKDELTIVVLDVSRPQSMIEATQKRRSKS